MLSTQLTSRAAYLRYMLGFTASVIVCWAIWWVCTRPVREKRQLAGRTEIVLIHWGGHEEDEIVESLCKSFEVKHPAIRIKRLNASAGYATKVQTMVAAGNPPDVIFMNSHMLPQYVGSGVLMPLDAFIGDDTRTGDLALDMEDYYPQTLDSFRYDGTVTGRGRLYGLPSSWEPLGFYYNKILFDRAGVAYPSDAWTWEEFEEKARAIGRLDGCYGAEFAIWTPAVRAYLWSCGLDFFAPGFDRVTVTEPEVVAALERLYSWRYGPDAGRMLTSVRSGVESGEGAFRAGKVGMTGPTSRWVVPEYRKLDETVVDWEFVQLPRGSSDKNLAFVAAWSVAAKTRHPREAWLVAKHMATPEAQAINSRYGLALPPLRSVAVGPDFVQPSLRPYRDDQYLLAAERACAAQWPTEPKFLTFLSNHLSDCLQLGKQPSVDGRTSVSESMQQVAEEWERELASPLRGKDFPAMPWQMIVGVLVFAALLSATVGISVWYRRRPRNARFREELAGLAMISPWMIGLAVFVAGPMICSLLLAFAKWSGLTTLDQAMWVGTRNWVQMLLRDRRMLRSLWVTVYYVVLMVPVGQIVALSIAGLLNTRIRGINLFRSLWYLPSVLAGVGTAVMWQWVFDAEHGLLNQLLRPVLAVCGLTPPEWFLRDAEVWGVPAFVIMSIWTTGGPMLIYLAGLNAIPKTLYEAAEIDGAGWWHRFRAITIPMLSPVILFNGIMAIIGSFQVFTQAFVVTRGGPGDATRFYVLYMYDTAFTDHDMGYAAAMAWLLFAVVLALTLFVMRSSRKRVYYEGTRA